MRVWMRVCAGMCWCVVCVCVCLQHTCNTLEHWIEDHLYDRTQVHSLLFHFSQECSNVGKIFRVIQRWCEVRNAAERAYTETKKPSPQPSCQLGWAMNWVDRLRTSADKRMWSGRRAVVMVWWAAVGCGCSALIRRSSWTAIGLLATKGNPPPDCSGQGEGRIFLASSRASRAVAAAPSFQTCLRACIYTICMCVCIYVYVCMCADMYIYIYMCMCVCTCICMRLYTCVCVCVCIFVHRLWVSVSVLQRVDGVMHAHVCSCTYVCICIWVWVCIYMCIFLQWVLHALWKRCFGH